MATEIVEMVLTSCDGCGKATLTQKHDLKANGWYMDVSEISDHGGDGRHGIYACSKKCIVKAITAAFARRV